MGWLTEEHACVCSGYRVQGAAMPPREQTKATKAPRAPHELAKILLAGGGLVAALGVVSCCALPLALSVLGFSAASLFGIGFLAAQNQPELFYGAVVLLAAAGVVLWRQRDAISCSAGTLHRRPALD